jgi:hypothetical protein
MSFDHHPEDRQALPFIRYEDIVIPPELHSLSIDRIDPKRLERIRAKLVEYQQRYTDQTHQEPGKQDLNAMWDTYSKIIVLSKLLENGSLTLESVGLDPKLQHFQAGSMQEGFMRNAWVVIADYIRTGGEYVEGGTRLPAYQP